MNRLKKIEILKLQEGYLKFLYWFFSFPDRYISLNNLSQALNVSKTTARMMVNKLVNIGFLKKEEIGRVWRISCNKEHKYNYSIKIGYNLSTIYESNIIEEIHKKIRNPRVIILFGSYRKGDNNEKSDIDVAVEVLGNEELKIYTLMTIPQFGYRKNVPVNLHVFSRNKIDLNLFSNITNGIVLEGFLEVRP